MARRSTAHRRRRYPEVEEQRVQQSGWMTARHAIAVSARQPLPSVRRRSPFAGKPLEDPDPLHDFLPAAQDEIAKRSSIAIKPRSRRGAR